MLKSILAYLRLLGHFLADFFHPFRSKGLRLSHYVAILVTVLVLEAPGFAAGVFVGRATAPPVSGGYQAAPLPPSTTIGGGVVPASWSLDRYLVRVHNQGDSNSCVAQSISEITEVIQNERHRGQAFSPGFIWNSLNGGQNQGLTYDAAFAFYTAHGDAPLSAFTYDGLNTNYWVGVPESAFQAAYPYHPLTWASLSPWDRVSIERSIHDGVPVAFAIPVYSSFYNQWGLNYVPSLTSQYGSFMFWHSMVVVAYDPTGVTIVNSWGPGWGGNGRAHLSWDFLGQQGAVLATITPQSYVPPKPKHPKPAFSKQQARIYEEYRAEHHLTPIPYQDTRHHLTWAASVWKTLKSSRIGGILHSEKWYPPKKGRKYGYLRDSYQGGAIMLWPRFHTAKVMYWKHWRR